MERKFESELAGKVALRSKGSFPGRKAGVLVLAIISSAIMIGAAAVTFSMKASAEDGIWTDYEPVMDPATDYLVYDPAEEAEFTDLIYSDDPIYADDFVVKRSSELKSALFDNLNGNGPEYTKIVYSVNVKLRHTAPFGDAGPAGLEIASLVISGFDQTPTYVTSTVLLNGEISLSGGISYDTDNGDGTVAVDLYLPLAVDYASYDSISFFIMFKVPQVGLDLSGVEIGFPSYQIVD